MKLFQTFDDRDHWSRARRMEIFRYAQELGVAGIKDSGNGIPPKDLMVKILQSLGHPPPQVPSRIISADDPRSGDTSPTSHRYTGPTIQGPPETVEMDATAVLARDWQQQQSAPPSVDVAAMSITELRKECKRRGIKMARTDNMPALKAKLNG